MRGGGRADEAHERQWVAGRLLELEDMPIGDLEVDDAAFGGADDGGGAIGVRLNGISRPDCFMASSAAAAANKL